MTNTTTLAQGNLFASCGKVFPLAVQIQGSVGSTPTGPPVLHHQPPYFQQLKDVLRWVNWQADCDSRVTSESKINGGSLPGGLSKGHLVPRTDFTHTSLSLSFREVRSKLHCHGFQKFV